MAEYYSTDLSEEVIRGLTENAMKCKFNGSPITFGFNFELAATKLEVLLSAYFYARLLLLTAVFEHFFFALKYR